MPAPPLADRLVGAVVGAAVADAACQPLHWNYDVDALDAKLAAHGASAAPEFLPQAAMGNPFYSLPTGKQTCYGDQSHVLLRSLVASGGALDAQHFADSLVAFFAYDAAGSDYPSAAAQEARGQGEVLVGGWRHGSVKGLLRNAAEGRTAYNECGSADEQVDGVAKIAPLIAAFAHKKNSESSEEGNCLASLVARAVRVVQNTDVAADNAVIGARILELALGGATIAEALAQCIEELRVGGVAAACCSGDSAAIGEALAVAVARAAAPHRDVVGELGRS